VKVTVLFFASARDAVGMSETVVDLSNGSSIDNLIASNELAPLKPFLPSMRFAINEEFSPNDAALSDGDVVAVIPPVSGG